MRAHLISSASAHEPAIETPPATNREGLESRGPMDWLHIVRLEVDAHLEEYFAAKRIETRDMSPPTGELVDEVESLTMRGGKRLRPALVAAGYRCIRPGFGMERLVDVSASLELLQTFLLIHDDWMDGDEVRRGKAAVHTNLQRKHGDRHLGAALGVLAGDFASAYAWELFLDAPYPVQSWPAAQRLFIDMHKRVYCGQHLDLVGDDDISRMHALKTTSYSVRGPLLLGALLGNPSSDQVQALSAWAGPIGEAFQIRDDLLGSLGSTDRTGKPGMDIAHGKLTSVIAELRRSTDRESRAPVETAFGNRDADPSQLAAAQTCLRDSGVVERLEARIAALRGEASSAFDGTRFNPQGRDMLDRLADKLTDRNA